MSLPFLGKKKRNHNKRKSSKKQVQSQEQPQSRMEKLGNAIGSNALKPVGFVAQRAISGIASELPEIGMLLGAMSGIVSDISHIFSKEKRPDEDFNKKSKDGDLSELTNTAKSSNSVLKNIYQAIQKQTQFLTKGFADVNNNLDTLDSINIELRTLNSITAKVWDVSKKQLSDTRAYQKKLLESQEKSRFEQLKKDTPDDSFGNIMGSVGGNPQGLKGRGKGFIFGDGSDDGSNDNKPMPKSKSKGILGTLADFVVEHPAEAAGGGLLANKFRKFLQSTANTAKDNAAKLGNIEEKLHEGIKNITDRFGNKINPGDPDDRRLIKETLDHSDQGVLFDEKGEDILKSSKKFKDLFTETTKTSSTLKDGFKALGKKLNPYAEGGFLEKGLMSGLWKGAKGIANPLTFGEYQFGADIIGGIYDKAKEGHDKNGMAGAKEALEGMTTKDVSKIISNAISSNFLTWFGRLIDKRLTQGVNSLFGTNIALPESIDKNKISDAIYSILKPFKDSFDDLDKRLNEGSRLNPTAKSSDLSPTNSALQRAHELHAQQKVAQTLDIDSKNPVPTAKSTPTIISAPSTNTKNTGVVINNQVNERNNWFNNATNV